MKIKREKPLILVVDDFESHLKAIGNTLINSGFEVALAFNGKRAIDIAKKSIPDLILLDIVMPEISGFDVCKILKENEETQEIPIIFLSSQKETEMIIKGFQLGAVDYIVKPANRDETLARVNNHLELVRAREQILEQNRKMLDLLNEKNEFLELASKDLRNPINEIRGYVDLIAKTNLNTNIKSPEIKSYTDKVEILIRQMTNIINDLLFLNDVEQGRVKSIFQSIDFDLSIQKIIKEYELRAKAKRITFDYQSDLPQNTLVSADKERFDIVLDNLISNAVKYSKFYKCIYIRTKQVLINKQETVVLEIRDQGVGMTQQDLQNIYTKFAKLTSQPTDNEGSIGLGIYTVKLLLDEMKGTIKYESKEDVGTLVTVTLPIAF